MFSNANAKQADMCRFCWMCRHICPVAGATGSEGWGPRARGLMVSMIERGTAYDTEIADAMYHCSMCDACANDCVTGWRPTDFIREARMLALVNDIAPDAIMKEIDNILARGNIYGLQTDAELKKLLSGLPEKAETLVFLGQTGRTLGAQTAIAFLKTLEQSGVSFSVLREEKPSGAYLADLMGYTGEVQQLAAETAEQIRATGARTLVALNPYDAVMFRDLYAQWKLLPEICVLSAPAFLAGLIEEGIVAVSPLSLRASLQEPVKLTRGLDETEPLLAIVRALGIDLAPMFLNGKMSRCIGTPLLDGYDANAVRQMTRVRFSDVRRTGSSVLIACSPDDICLLRKYAPEDITVCDLFALVYENLKK